jgi:hypothetical protein
MKEKNSTALSSRKKAGGSGSNSTLGTKTKRFSSEQDIGFNPEVH